MNVCVFIGRCWNQPSLFCRCCYCGTLQHVVEGWIQTRRSRAATQLYRILSTWRLITWTLPAFRLAKTRINWVDLWFHASQLRTEWKENLLNVFLFLSSRWFMCWTWLQPSCTRWFWVLRRTYTPCSFAWRHTLSPTSPRWVRSCCWRRESPSTHADRPHTVCQRDWYVTHTHINIECLMSNSPSQLYIGSKRLLFDLHNWILFLFWIVWLSLLLFFLFLVISKCLTQYRLLLQFLFYFYFFYQ